MDFDHTNNGSNPQKIIITGDLLYGICFEGGANDDGLIFKINTDGSDFQKVDLYGQYGSGPTSLAISNNVLYGATISGGDYDDGVLFKIDANGYKIFHHFNHDATIPLLYDILVSQNMVYGIA